MKIRFLLLALLLAVTCSAAVIGKEDKPPTPKDIDVPMVERPCIAVMSFDNGSIQRQDWWGTDWDVGKGLADILITTMLEKNRFRLMERTLLEKVISEQDLGTAGRLDPVTAAKVGKIIGADYLVIGSVTDFSWDKKTSGIIVPIGGIGGIGGSRTKAHVAVDLRVVDSTTGEILGSYTGAGTEDKGSLIAGHSDLGALVISSSDFMSTILGRATKKALTQWSDNLCIAQDQAKLVLTPKNKPIMRPDGVVLMVDGSNIISNCGTSKGYVVGDKIEIHRKGRELTDPETGEVLRVLSDLIATGTITKVDEKTADITFTVISQSLSPMEGDMVKCVPMPAPPPVSTPAPQENITPSNSN